MPRFEEGEEFIRLSTGTVHTVESFFLTGDNHVYVYCVDSTRYVISERLMAKVDKQERTTFKTWAARALPRGIP